MFGQVLAESNGGLISVYVVAAVLTIISVAGMWATLSKAGEPGAWSLLLLTGCLSPVAFFPVCKITGRPGWWVILLYIPIVNIVVLIILSIDLAKAFGKGTGFGIGLWLLHFIFYPILGFGSARYQGQVASR
jgi:hypothetical protein